MTKKPNPPSQNVDLLILGAGWTSQFLIPLLHSSSITFAATTTTGHPSPYDGSPTLPFLFDPSSTDTKPYSILPRAKTVLVTFPLKGIGQSKHLVDLYRQTHGLTAPTTTDEEEEVRNNWIQLGSTSIFISPLYNDHTSPHDTTNPRAIAEDELLSLYGGSVLNLAGLYGGERSPRNWVTRVARSKEEVKGKKALHLVHGVDVARAIVALHRKFTPGKRWLVTDLRVNDWWDLIQSWGAGGVEKKDESDEYARWVGELMIEEGVESLPRHADSLGRVLDSRAFWAEVGIWPIRGRVP